MKTRMGLEFGDLVSKAWHMDPATVYIYLHTHTHTRTHIVHLLTPTNCGGTHRFTHTLYVYSPSHTAMAYINSHTHVVGAR